jgi:hypothetical protein
VTVADTGRVHILRGYVRCPLCAAVGPPASVSLALGVDTRRVRCMVCGGQHVIDDVGAAVLVHDTSVVCPHCHTRIGCPTAANVVRCQGSVGLGCGLLFAGPTPLDKRRRAVL